MLRATIGTAVEAKAFQKTVTLPLLPPATPNETSSTTTVSTSRNLRQAFSICQIMPPLPTASVSWLRPVEMPWCQIYDTCGRFWAQGLASSKAADAAMTVDSSPSRPTMCSPMGMPSDEKPQGTLAAV